MSGFVVFLGLNLAAASAAAAPLGSPESVVVTPAYINRLAEELRVRHPALQAAQARTDAAAAAVEGVRVWEDPALRVGGMFADAEMRAREGDLVYGVEQKLPVFGRPGLAREVARAEVARQQADGDYQFQLRRRDLAQALYRAALAQRVVEIGVQDQAWLDRIVQSLEQRYRTGASNLADLLRAQNEQRRRREQTRTEQSELEHARFVLNRLLQRPPEAPWPPLNLPPPVGAVPYSPQLADLAIRQEPRLRVLQEEIREAQAAARLARRQRFPQVLVGAQGRNATHDGEFRQAEVMLGFTFPWGNTRKYRADFERERARARAAEADASDRSLGVREEVHQLTVEVDAARREALLYRDEIVPRARQALEASETAWAANRSSFLDVMDLHRLLLESQLTEARALAAQYDRLAELVLFCGVEDLEALDRLGIQPSTPEAASIPPSPIP